MFKNFSDYSNTIATQNEDACFSCEKFLFVLDGATGLFASHFTDFKSDSQWLSHTVKSYLVENLEDTNKDLSEIVAAAARYAKEAFSTFKTDVTITEYPSSSCSIVRIKGEFLEYISMGDSPILILQTDGEILEIYEEALRNLDEIAIDEAIQIAKTKGISVMEARPHIAKTLEKHRMLLNQTNGYHAISLDEKAAFSAQMGRIPLSEIQAVAILSDGFAQHYNVLNLSKNTKDFFELLNCESLKNLFEEIIKCQKADGDCCKFPRFKISDDASIALGYI